MNFSMDDFEDRAAVLEFDNGMTRFAAETEAARRQGINRWEAINAIRNRNSQAARDHCAADAGQPTGGMSGVQPASQKEKRSMPERHVQA